MSDDRKRNARLQGKFSDPKESRSGRRDKQSEKKSSLNKNSENNDRNMKGHASKSKSAEGVNLEYQEKSKYTFEALSTKIKPKEIRDKGVYELSETTSGVSRIIYEPEFLSLSEADEMFHLIKSTTDWCDKDIVINKQNYPQPRLVAWYGPFDYKYSGAVFKRAPMPTFIVQIKERAEAYLQSYGLNVNLNSVLLNLYRNEKDSVAWHSDDELSMGVAPTIASVSLGEMRTFQIRPKDKIMKSHPEEYEVNLVSGSLLVMDGCMQTDYQHQVPKEYHDKGPRINLTFRTVYEVAEKPTKVPSDSKDCAESDITSKTTQSKPVYDSDNFPPLNPSSDPTSNVSKTNSWSKNKSPHKKDILEEDTKVASESESAINPAENDCNPVSSSTSELSSPTKLVDNTEPDDVAKSQSEEENHVPEDSSTNNLEEIEAVCTGGHKYKLNVNAPDFVPTTPLPDPTYEKFKGCSLKDLSEVYSNSNDSFDESEFFYALIHELHYQRNKDYFSPRDWMELEVYIKLSEIDQSVESQKVISKRIVSMIQNLNKNYKRNMTQRTSRGRNSYRGNFYRM